MVDLFLIEAFLWWLKASSEPEDISPWLPILSAIGSLGVGALVGGLGGAYASHHFAVKRDEEAKERERDGLLHLVNSDMTIIGSTADEFLRNPAILDFAESLATSTDAWESARVQLAQLLPKEEFPTLATYFQLVQVLRNQQHFWRRVSADETKVDVAKNTFRSIEKQIEVIKEYHQRVQKILQKYIDTSPPTSTT